MSIKNKIVIKNATVRGYQARGTSPAELRSTGPKQRPERVATMPGVRGESARRGVSSNDMDKDYIEHCRKFFKGEVE